MSTKNVHAEAIKKTLSEINDILAKSGYPMEKTEGEEEEMENPQEGEQELSQDSAAAPEEQEAPMEEGEQPEEQEAPEQDSGSPEMKQIQEFIAQMSPEELDEMMQMLAAEKEARGSSEAQPQEQPAPAPQEDQMQKSKAAKESQELKKSLDKMASTIEKLNKEVASLKKDKFKPTSKAAAANTSNVQALEKSAKPAERLSKSDTMEFLMQRLRQRDPIVNSSVIADVNSAQTPDELRSIQVSLEKKGLTFPKV